MAVSAGIVVTGTEVLTGRVQDRNGPWLAEQLRLLGVDVGQVLVVGDRPDDLRSALAYLAGHNDLVLTSGGLGPTADDLTAEIVAAEQGRPLRLDEALEARIAAIVERLMARLGTRWDDANTAAATRKQAMVPAGATVLEPSGTAPGLVVPVADGRTGPPVVVLPGPPGELQRMWPDAIAAEPVRAVLAGAPELRQRTMRLWGVPESELAAVLRGVEGELGGLEVTTCLRDGELEVVTRYAPDAEPAQQRLLRLLGEDFPAQLFSPDGRTIDEIVTAELASRGWRAGVVERFTAGALAARLARTGRLAGAVVAGSDGVLPPRVPNLDVEGGSGAAIAGAMAAGARAVLGADVGIGVAALDPDVKPGTVHLAIVTPEGERGAALPVIGGETVGRLRATALALHLLRQALSPAGASPGPRGASPTSG